MEPDKKGLNRFEAYMEIDPKLDTIELPKNWYSILEHGFCAGCRLNTLKLRLFNTEHGRAMSMVLWHPSHDDGLFYDMEAHWDIFVTMNLSKILEILKRIDGNGVGVFVATAIEVYIPDLGNSIVVIDDALFYPLMVYWAKEKVA